MNHCALEIDRLDFQFCSKSMPFFKRLSMKLEAGKIHSLRGKNGSGKSTLFSILQGEIGGKPKSSGILTIQGESYSLRDIHAISKQLQMSIAFVSQRYDAMIADQFSFEENLQFANLPQLPLPWEAPKVTQPLPSFLERFGIDCKKQVCKLSGGQRQILALLMVLQRNPAILLLDEPTATLDATNARMVFDFLSEIVESQNRTVLLVCHDPELSARYCTGSAFELIVDEYGSRMLI